MRSTVLPAHGSSKASQAAPFSWCVVGWAGGRWNCQGDLPWPPDASGSPIYRGSDEHVSPRIAIATRWRCLSRRAARAGSTFPASLTTLGRTTCSGRLQRMGD